METKTLTFKAPNGYMFATTGKDSVEIEIRPEKPKNVLERILTDDDVLADNGLTWEQFNIWCAGLDEDEVATRFIKLLVKSLNGEWTPDFDNSNQTKYEPRFIGGSSGFRYYDDVSWNASSYVGSRLCLESSDKAIHAGTKFTKWYKKIIVIK